MKVLLAGGGTAGHINPALAIAGAIRKHDKSAEIMFADVYKRQVQRVMCTTENSAM